MHVTQILPLRYFNKVDTVLILHPIVHQQEGVGRIG